MTVLKHHNPLLLLKNGLLYIFLTNEIFFFILTLGLRECPFIFYSDFNDIFNLLYLCERLHDVIYIPFDLYFLYSLFRL